MKRSVRSEIMAATWRCFQEFGVRNTRAEDVARQAGISRSSFYRYFKGIDEVMAAIAAESGKRNLREALDKSQEGAGSGVDWPRFVCHAIEGLSGSILSDLIHKDHMMTVVSMIYGQRVGTHFIDLMTIILPDLEADQRRGKLAREISAEAMAEWLLRQVWNLSSAPPPDGWINEGLIEYVNAFVVPGIRASAPDGGTRDVAKQLGSILATVRTIEAHLITSSQ